MPGITVAGCFTEKGRKGSYLHSRSGLIVLDFDHVSNAEEFRNKLGEDPHTRAVFISPSGDGVKAFVCIDLSLDHATAYEGAAAYYKAKYNIAIDSSGKDVSRLCFISVDKGVIDNPNVVPIPRDDVVGDQSSYLSECSKFLYNSECSTSSTFLHDTSDDTQSTIASIKAHQAFQKHPLAKLYTRWVQNVHVVEKGRRNESLIEIVTFTTHCIGADQVLLFAGQYYDENQTTWEDSKEQHMKEAEHHLDTILSNYTSTLPKQEREIYAALDLNHQAAFRICRDLASRPESRDQSIFFISCANLGVRLGIDQRGAHRILKKFASYKFLKITIKGTRREAGVKPKATTYKWLYSLKDLKKTPQ